MSRRNVVNVALVDKDSDEETGGDSADSEDHDFTRAACGMTGPFGDDVSKEFQVRSCLAMRVALYVTIYSAIAVILHRHRLTGWGFSASSILCNVLFIIGSDVGSTCQNALYGTAGTMIAWLALWILYGCYPHGYTEGHRGIWTIGIATVILYTLAFLFLNVNENVRFFALLNFTGGWAMDFLNPFNGSSTGYAKGFEFKLTGKAENALILYLVAAVLALLIYLGAWPITGVTALKKSQSKIRAVVAEMRELQLWLLEYYCGTELTLQVHNLEGKFVTLKEKLDEAQAHSDASWFESFGKSKRRLLTARVVEMISDLLLRWEPVFPVVASEDFGASHRVMMKAIGTPLYEIIVDVHKMLKLCVTSSVDGILDDDERKELQAAMDTIPSKVALVQRSLKQATAQFGAEPVNYTVLGEHYFAYAMCDMAQEACVHTKNMMRDKSKVSLRDVIKGRATTIFMVHKGDFWWAVRTSLSILINFLIGYVGICDQEAKREWNEMAKNVSLAPKLLADSPPDCFLKAYSPDLASINVILLSRHTASTFKSALDRVNIVILAMVAGQIGFMMLGGCNEPSRWLTLVGVFAFTLAGMYMNYSGGQNAALGARLAAIGVSAIMADCTDKTDTEQKWANSYHSLTGIVLGVVVMLAVDAVLGDEAASSKAMKAGLAAIENLQDTFRKYLNNDIDCNQFQEKMSELQAQIAEAKAYGEDAVNQPNFWRKPWNQGLFSEVISTLSTLTAHLRNLGRCVGEDKQTLIDQLPSFKDVRAELLGAADFTEEVTIEALRDEPLSIESCLNAPLKSEGLESLNSLIADMNKQYNVRLDNAEDDVTRMTISSRRCVIALTLDQIMRVLKSSQIMVIKKKNK